MIIQVSPPRMSPKGRVRPAQYLVRFNYPPLLSDWAENRPTITVAASPDEALRYESVESIEASMELLRSLGYDPIAVVI